MTNETIEELEPQDVADAGWVFIEAAETFAALLEKSGGWGRNVRASVLLVADMTHMLITQDRDDLVFDDGE